jgi:hypothetical protein
MKMIQRTTYQHICDHRPNTIRDTILSSEAAGEEEMGREEPETQWREKRARTMQPSTKCPHNRQRSKCKECGGASICQHLRIRSQCKHITEHISR